MHDSVKEFDIFAKKLGDIPFVLAIPQIQKELHRIGEKYNVSPADVFSQYMDWKSSQK